MTGLLKFLRPDFSLPRKIIPSMDLNGLWGSRMKLPKPGNKLLMITINDCGNSCLLYPAGKVTDVLFRTILENPGQETAARGGKEIFKPDK